MNRIFGVAGVVGLMVFALPSYADNVYLNDWCVSVNGDITAACNDFEGGTGTHLGVDISNFDTTLNADGTTQNHLGVGNAADILGWITVSLGPGLDQYVNFYADYDLNFTAEGQGNGSFGDLGLKSGLNSSQVSWWLQDPSIESDSGVIGADFIDSNPLPNVNEVLSPATCAPNNSEDGCDVAWALGVNGLDILPGGTGSVTFTVSSVRPEGESTFFLTQYQRADPIYLSVDFTINNPEVNLTPEPGTFALAFGGIALAAGFARRRRSRVF